MDMSRPPQLNLPTPKARVDWRIWLIIGLVLVLGLAIGLFIVWRVTLTMLPSTPEIVVPVKSTQKPTLATEPVATGYDHIWDIAFLPSGDMLFSERKGAVHIVQNGQPRKLHDIPDVAAKGEGGLLGIEVDPAFAQNRYVYTCFNSNKTDVRVARWKLSPDNTTLTDRADIITGLPANVSGRHSGCRVKFGPDGYLYIGTGDAAQGNAGIDHKNLGGKVLRIDRNGDPAPNEMGSDFDPRIFSFGHRNVQGIAFFDTSQNGVLGVTIEHGSSLDDEVNLLIKGNFGWAHPAGPYTETNVPMTDKTNYPDAIDAIWSSGTPTIAPSGATFLRGSQWKAWEGALAMAVLKGKYLKLLNLNEKNQVTSTEDLFANQFGRLRTAVMGPDGNLYISTDNGGNDQIIRVTPQ